MNHQFKLGWPDYLLIALTCGLVLIAMEYLFPRIEDQFRTRTGHAVERDEVHGSPPIPETAHD